MCDELQNGSLPLLIVTPNGRDDTGTNRDCFLLNPNAKTAHHLQMFKFLGNYYYYYYYYRKMPLECIFLIIKNLSKFFQV